MKKFFQPPKKTAIAVICIVEILVVLGGITACTAVSDKKAEQTQITLERAEEIALSDAGLTTSEVTSIKTKSDTDDGISTYDVEFYTEDLKYEYIVKADTGVIYSKSKEKLANQEAVRNGNNENVSSASETQQDSNLSNEQQAVSDSNGPSQNKQQPQQNGNQQVSLDTAKSTALTDAGLSDADVTFTKEKIDYEDGIAVYDIEFYTSTHAYEYEINATTGAVYSKDTEVYSTGIGYIGHDLHDEHDKHHGYTGNTTDAAAYIGEDKAKSIAVDHAGFSAADVSFLKVELDSDDGQIVYEVEFYKDGREYEYTINASTGTIIEYDID